MTTYRPQGLLDRVTLPLALGASLLAASPAAGAAEDGPAERAIVVSPRAEARIGTQELVVLYRDRKLIAFLQRFTDGIPTTGASIEVTADLIPGTLEEVAPGIYSGSDWTLSGGRNEIEVAVTIDGTTETATMPLVIPSTAQLTGQTAALTAVPVRTVPTTALAVAAIATYLAVTLLFWRRSRRSRDQAA